MLDFFRRINVAKIKDVCDVASRCCVAPTRAPDPMSLNIAWQRDQHILVAITALDDNIILLLDSHSVIPSNYDLE